MELVWHLSPSVIMCRRDPEQWQLTNTIFDGVLTESQVSRIPKLQIGENILCISSDKNLEFKVYLTKEEEQIFEGGV